MKKKIVSLLVVLCMVLSLLPLTAAAADVVDRGECGAQGDHVTWTLYTDGRLTISGKGEMPDYPDENPDHDKYPYYSNYCNDILSVVIDDGVTHIGKRAFSSCKNLSEVSISDTVTSVGAGAFEETALYKDPLRWENGILYIDRVLIKAKREVESCVIRDGIRVLADDALLGCSKLTNVTIPDSVTSIGKSAFSSCYMLTNVTIPGSVTSIGDSAFFSCSSLTTVTIPGSVTNIGDFAFDGCTGLKSVTIQEGVESIGNASFMRCLNLESLELPNSLLRVGKDAFQKTMLLADESCWEDDLFYIDNVLLQAHSGCVEVEIRRGTRVIGDNVFASFEKLESIAIPDGVIAIPNGAFSGCSKLTNITIPTSVTRIGDSAFQKCRSLESVTIPDSVTSIGDYAFCQCERMAGVAIPDGVTSIGEDAFNGCSGFTSVTIPNSVTTIGRAAFVNCINLTSAELSDKLTSIEDSVFSSCWSLTTITIPDGVTSIGAFAFFSCTNLTEITLPDSLTSIGDSAFERCTSLTEIMLPDSLASIGYDAFYCCSSLTHMMLPARIQFYSVHPFKGCSSLVRIDVAESNPVLYSVDGVLYFNGGREKRLVCCPPGRSGVLSIPDDITWIADHACYGCAGLTGVDLPDQLRTIGNDSFRDCTGLTDIRVPEGTTAILARAFNGCSSLSTVTIPSSVGGIFQAAFGACVNLTSVMISDLDAWCRIRFDDAADNPLSENCYLYLNGEAVKDLQIPTSVTSVRNYTFAGYSGLLSAEIPNSVTSIGEGAFFGCSGMKHVTISASVNAIGQNAFDGCSSLTDVYYGGSEAQWEQIEIQMYNDPLKNATIHFNSTGPSSPDGPDDPVVLNPMRDSGTFHYYADHLHSDNLIPQERAQYTYQYDEKWFENSATTYQHELARMSLRMAMAGMAKTGTPDPTDYTNIQELLTQLEYSDLYFDYPDTEINSIGYAIGSKNLRGGDGKVYSLVSVVIRSAGYFDEWGGNVTLGPGGNHHGFQLAANQTLTGIEDYIDRLQRQGKLTNSVKIWITGYSRGAATANLAAAKLNETYGKNNVFAYCFECPMGAIGADVIGAQYNNIFCIVNPIDLVPKVAMHTWGFNRYGNTYYLPASSNTVNYFPMKAKMLQAYANLLKESGGTNTALGLVSVTRELPYEQSALFDRFIDTIAANLGGRRVYYELHEKNFAQTVADLMGKNGSFSAKDAAELLHLITAEFAGSQFHKDSLFGMEIGTVALNMKYAHYPELALAWLDTLDGETLRSTATGYRTIYVNCPVDVSVYDDDNHLVAQITNDVPQEIENGISAYVDENGQKLFVLPMDMEYRLDVKATDDGTVTYTAADYDMSLGDYTQVVSYQEVPVEKGDTLTGVASAPEGADPTYTLSTEDGSVLTPDVSEQGDEVQTWTVQTVAQAGGNAAGGGVFVNGEFAKVTARPADGWRFLGWYDRETLISEETEYRFAVTKDIELTARFEKNADPGPTPSENPFEDVAEGQFFYDSVLWAVSQVPQITKGTDETHFSPDATCTRSQVVTFLWRAAGQPEPVTTENPFADVSPDAYYYDAVLWAVENGITQGTGNGMFSPDGACTRAQVVTFLWRAEHEPKASGGNSFPDVPNDAFYAEAVLWAVENGITQGTGGGLFSPDVECTRAQIVTFLFRDMGD